MAAFDFGECVLPTPSERIPKSKIPRLALCEGLCVKLLDEIVDLLSNEKGSLTDALLKTKVVLHKIGHKELVEWVNDELNGYAQGREVPTYRVIPARVVGNLQNAAFIYERHTLPISHLSEKERKHFSTNEMRESIRVLEEFAAKPDGHLIHPIAPELYSKLGEALDNVWVQKAWVQMEPTQIMNTLIEVRSRLLDFALNLQDKLGDTENDTDAKQVAQTFDARAMFQHTVIGDNATFVLGDHNATTIKNSVKKGDFGSLSAALRGYGVSNEDIDSLEASIDQDNGAVDVEKKSFGPAVRGWMSEMMGKAVNAAWNIELSIAGGLLTNALQAYYFS